MADVMELRCWPSCVNAIDWSQDGIIALASDERVELLFPNTANYDTDQETTQWQHVPLKVPLFSSGELPVKESAPLPTFSIGEEISNSAPIAVSWSPPGLAQHRRCALAALTANLVLSVWSAEGHPQEERSWKRRLIVNDALATHFTNDTAINPSHVTSGYGEQMRLRTRIRAFAWAPALPSCDALGIVGTRLVYGQHILIVSNDDNQIIFVVVDSPTTTLGVEQCWTANVLTHHSITPDPGSIFLEPTVFDDKMKQTRHSSHIAWSPWVRDGEYYRSVIAYSTNDDVRVKVVTYHQDNIKLSDEVIHSDMELRSNGPMTWSPTVEAGNKLKLALFTASGLLYLAISVRDASIVERHTHDLGGRWDQISGAVWDSSQHPTLRLHFSSLLSTLQNPTAVIEASSRGLTSLTSPNWKDQIENSLVLFGVKNDLRGNSKVKVWGLTASPLGDFIAACNSVHPSDMIEYGAPAERRSTIAINTMRQYTNLRQGFPLRDVSAEGVFFSLRKLAENTVEVTDQMPAFAKEMTEKLMQVYGPLPRLRDSTGNSVVYPNLSSIDSHIRDLRQAAFLDLHTLKERYTILVSQACNIKGSSDLSMVLIVYHLAITIQALPSSLAKTSFSAEVLAHHQSVISLICGVTKDEMEPGSSLEIPTTRSVIDEPFVTYGADMCDFCSALIPLTDLKSAACTNGHTFARCGLSFLAIQAPGITKYCGICSTPFLADEFVAAQEPEQDTEHKAEDNVEMRRSDEIGEHSFIPQHPQSQEADTRKGCMDLAMVDGEIVIRQEIAQEQTQRAQIHQAARTEPENSGVDDKTKERQVTLAKVLFLACDVCIYCGGRFAG